jgi:3-isopropylmalate/(R)-2-methylmalate dehydratase small subunit
LDDYGFRAVIASSFADIFFNNSFKNGLLPVALPADVVEQLFAEVAAAPGYELTIDLPQQQVIAPSGARYGFEIDAFRKNCLVNGLDEIGLSLQNAEAIRSYEALRRVAAPWLFQQG